LLHPRSADRHTWDRETDGVRMLDDESLNVGRRHMALDDIAVDLGGVAGGKLELMPACCLISASIPGSVGCTVGRRPFASRCLTQLPQQVQIADFHTSTELSIAAKAGEVQSIARDRAKTGRMAIGIFSPRLQE
jgi:hypothetical protein